MLCSYSCSCSTHVVRKRLLRYKAWHCEHHLYEITFARWNREISRRYIAAGENLRKFGKFSYFPPQYASAFLEYFYTLNPFLFVNPRDLLEYFLDPNISNFRRDRDRKMDDGLRSLPGRLTRSVLWRDHITRFAHASPLSSIPASNKLPRVSFSFVSRDFPFLSTVLVVSYRRIRRHLSRIPSILAILLISNADQTEILILSPYYHPLAADMLSSKSIQSRNRFSRAPHRAANNLIFARGWFPLAILHPFWSRRDAAIVLITARGRFFYSNVSL